MATIRLHSVCIWPRFRYFTIRVYTQVVWNVCPYEYLQLDEAERIHCHVFLVVFCHSQTSHSSPFQSPVWDQTCDRSCRGCRLESVGFPPRGRPFFNQLVAGHWTDRTHCDCGWYDVRGCVHWRKRTGQRLGQTCGGSLLFKSDEWLLWTSGEVCSSITWRCAHTEASSSVYSLEMELYKHFSEVEMPLFVQRFKNQV